MEAKASRMAHVESSKPGEEAEMLEVMPTRQFLSSAMGEPMPVASKMAAETAGAACFARLRGLAEAAGAAGNAVGAAAGGADEGVAWAARSAAAQTAIQTAVRVIHPRTFSRKAPPCRFPFNFTRSKCREQGKKAGTKEPRDQGTTGTRDQGNKGAPGSASFFEERVGGRDEGAGMRDGLPEQKKPFCHCYQSGTYLRLRDRAKRRRERRAGAWRR